MKQSGGITKRKKLRNFLPRSELARVRRFGSGTKGLQDAGNQSERDAHSTTSNNNLYPCYSISDSGSVSSISTAPSMLHPTIHSTSMKKLHFSSSRSVSSQNSAKHLALEALERESQLSIFSSADAEDYLPDLTAGKKLGSAKLNSDIRKVLDLSLESTSMNPAELRRSESPLPDVYVFRRLIGTELHDISSDSSAEKSKESFNSQVDKLLDSYSTQTDLVQNGTFIKNKTSVSSNSKGKTSVSSNSKGKTSVSSNSKGKNSVSSNSKSSQEEKEQGKDKVMLKILLLSPSIHLFEVISVKCPSKTTIQNIIQDIVPAKATKAYFQEQKYTGLFRAVDDAVEIFDNSLPINAYHVKIGEVLISIPSSQSVSDCLSISSAILNRSKKNVNATMIESNTLESLHMAEVLKTDTSKESKTKSLSGWNFAQTIFAVCALLLAAAVVAEHRKLIAPLKPGDTLHQGEMRSKCGLIGSVIPNLLIKCDPEIIELRSDGVLSFYRGEVKDLIWDIKPIENYNKGRSNPFVEMFHWGKQKSNTPVVASSASQFSSLYVDFGGNIFINGMKTEVFVHKDDGEVRYSFSPWPFALDPRYY